MALLLRIAKSGRRLPWPVGATVFLSLIGITMGLANGQGILPTLWGWWLVFKGPIVGLYAYYYKWDSRFGKRIKAACFAILLVQVVAQIYLYRMGFPIGDQLGGTLGGLGTGHLALLEILIFSLFVGGWLINHEMWALLIISGSIVFSSILGQMKIVPFAFIGILLSALVLQIRRKMNIKRAVRLIANTTIVAGLFFAIFFAVAPMKQKEEYRYILNKDKLLEYLNLNIPGNERDDIGRNLALVYAWSRINKSPLLLFFGEGLGARGESKALGTVGRAISADSLGLFSGSSLTVILGEMGVVGLLVGIGLWIGALHKIWRIISKNGRSENTAMAVGIYLYTLFWPLWLWYTSAWIFPAVTTLYWMIIGFLFRPQSKLLKAEYSNREASEIARPHFIERPGTLCKQRLLDISVS
jgi:hypothetical protein